MKKLPQNFSTTIITTILFYSLSAIAESSNLRTFNQQWGPFNQSHFQFFAVDPPATISNGALQVTPDSASADFNLNNQSGRVIFNRHFKLWEGNDVASFNTSFLINIYRPSNETPGEGLAFVIAPDLRLPVNSSGQFLGLTNSLTDDAAANKFVAVEFDTVQQDFDPDNNHVGININSVRSNVTESLSPHNITLAPIGARFSNVWVDYDGINMVMDVYMIDQPDRDGPIPLKPEFPILSLDNLNLISHVNQYSYFGFSASTGITTQLNCVLRWNLTVNYFADEENREWVTIALGVGIPLLVLLLISVTGLGYYCWRRKKASPSSILTGALKSLPGMPREFEFKELKKATNSFDENNKLGQGGFGVVYRGLLVAEKLEIAVKWFSRDKIKGEGDFLAELTIINRLPGINI